MKSISIMKIFAATLLSVAFVAPAVAQNAVGERDSNLRMMTSKGWEWQLNAGVNIGGATPLGMPREVRKVTKYNPGFNTMLQGKVIKWWDADRHWGTSLAIGVEDKAMKINADVKNYHTEIIRDNERVAGYWTGFVHVDYSSTFLTMPLNMEYRFNDRWRVRGGFFASYRLDGNFSGYVSDGYLRNNTPVGEKIEYKDGNRAAYEFDGDLRRWMWGAQIGGSWRAYRHFSVNADLSYSFNNIFRKDFTTVRNTLHPLYLNIGFGYTF